MNMAEFLLTTVSILYAIKLTKYNFKYEQRQKVKILHSLIYLIIVGIVLLFPMIFIFQGIIHSNSIKHLIIKFLLSSVIILLFFKEWYCIDDTFNLITRYILLGFVAFIIKKLIDFLKNNKLKNM